MPTHVLHKKPDTYFLVQRVRYLAKLRGGSAPNRLSKREWEKLVLFLENTNAIIDNLSEERKSYAVEKAKKKAIPIRKLAPTKSFNSSKSQES